MSQTSLDKITDFLISTEDRTLVITAEVGVSNILISVASKVSGVDLKAISTVEGRIKEVAKHEDKIKKVFNLPNGDSRFFCLDASKEVKDLQVEVLEQVLEHDLKQILVEPSHILFRGTTIEDFRSRNIWEIFKTHLELAYSVRILIIDDDMPMLVANNRG